MKVNVKVTGTLEQRAERAAEQAARVVLAELFSRFQASLTAPVWQWPRPTVRSNGGIVGSPRNVIDTGNLRGSGYFQYTGKYHAIFSWSANYATAVHEGARLRSGALLPARPWTSAVLGTQPINGIKVYPLAERSKQVWLRYFLR